MRVHDARFAENNVRFDGRMPFRSSRFTGINWGRILRRLKSRGHNASRCREAKKIWAIPRFEILVQRIPMAYVLIYRKFHKILSHSLNCASRAGCIEMGDAANELSGSIVRFVNIIEKVYRTSSASYSHFHAHSIWICAAVTDAIRHSIIIQ